MVQFRKQVERILSEVSEVAREMGPIRFDILMGNLHDAITKGSNTLTVKRIAARIEQIEVHIFDDKALNAAIERQTGCDIPPRLLGFVTVSDLRANRLPISWQSKKSLL